MANLDPLYIVGLELGEYFVDPRTGLPLSNGKIYFYKDLARAIPKLVYRLSGSPPNYEYLALPNYMELSAAGTIVDDNGDEVSIYYYPWNADGDIERYYIRVEAEDGETIKEFQAWPNNFEGSVTPGGSAASVENQIANSQFVDVLFNSELGVTIEFDGPVSAAEYEIAPDWKLRVSSNAAGSIIVGRTALEGSLNVPTNAPFMLSISPQGNFVSAISLVQRFANNPDIWANQYIAGSITVTSLDGINHSFEMQYAPSVALAPTVILTGASGASGYTTLSGTVLLAPGTNTESGDVAYDDIEIILPVSGNYAVTSVQVFGTDSAATLVPYQQETVNRQVDHLFHYYNPLIQQVPVPSILHGWDFRVNPAQWGNDITMASVASQYLWDQLIGWQSVNSCLRAYRAGPRALTLEHEAVAGQIAIIQYLSGPQLRQLLSNDFSVLMRGYTDRVGGAAGTVSFWYSTDATLPNVAAGTNLSLIATMDAQGKPTTFHGAWTELTRNYRGDGRFTIPYSSGLDYQEIALEGWNNPGNTINRDAFYGAIVVGFESYSDFHNVVFESISVTPGLLARPYAPLDYVNTLNQLQLYYKKSYGQDVNPGSITHVNALQFITLSTEVTEPSFENWAITIKFQDIYIGFEIMRVGTPIITIYSPLSGVSDRFETHTYYEGVLKYQENFIFSSYFVNQVSGSNGAGYINPPNLFVTFGVPEKPGLADRSNILLHYTADARYGIVL